MPKDLYKWEEGGGLKHHCPECHQPLTRPQASTICLGDHVEPCRGYHHQLFKTDGSEICDPCNRSEDQQYERSHRIAKLLLQLIKTKEDDRNLIQSSPLTPKSNNAASNHRTPGEEPRMNGKLRKAAKHAQKRAARPPVEVRAEEVERVTKLLHPAEVTTEADDPDFHHNRAFHPGTSNMREMRNDFIKKDKLRGNEALPIDPKQVKGLLEVLGAPPRTDRSSVVEIEIRAELEDLIKKDLLQAKSEADQLAMRKGGFLRWTGKRAWDRLVAYRKLRAEKSNPIANSSSAASVRSNGTPDLDADGITEPDSNIATPLEEDEAVELDMDELTESMLKVKVAAPKPPTPKHSKREASEQDSGWTTVAPSNKSKSKAKPIRGKLTLVHNGGLAKIASPVAPGNRYGFAYVDEDL